MALDLLTCASWFGVQRIKVVMVMVVEEEVQEIGQNGFAEEDQREGYRGCRLGR
jgi:methanogenic corrinoid protein MtbC1